MIDLHELGTWALLKFPDAHSVRILSSSHVHTVLADPERCGPCLNFSETHLRKLWEDEHIQRASAEQPRRYQ